MRIFHVNNTCRKNKRLRAYPRTLREGASGRERGHFQTVLGRAVRAYPRTLREGASGRESWRFQAVLDVQ